WIQIDSAGVEHVLSRELIDSKIVLTNMQRLYGPQVADQGFALLLGLTRGVFVSGNKPEQWERRTREANRQELHGQTMLVVGLGGMGTQAARRAHGFGMRVRAIDPKDMERPAFVLSLDKPAKLMELLPQADVVMLSCPLTPETRGMMGAKQFQAMKRTAYFIDVARGGLVQFPALVEALRAKQIAGVGLGVTGPEPPPARR